VSDEGFLQERIEAQAARIEALEAALRKIIIASEQMAEDDVLTKQYEIDEIARAALAPEKDR
jgi:hypothetical protein